MWTIPTGTSSALKKKIGKESQYMVSHPELGSDPPSGRIGNRGVTRIIITSFILCFLFHLIHIILDTVINETFSQWK